MFQLPLKRRLCFSSRWCVQGHILHSVTISQEEKKYSATLHLSIDSHAFIHLTFSQPGASGGPKHYSAVSHPETRPVMRFHPKPTCSMRGESHLRLNMIDSTSSSHNPTLQTPETLADRRLYPPTHTHKKFSHLVFRVRVWKDESQSHHHHHHQLQTGRQTTNQISAETSFWGRV